MSPLRHRNRIAAGLVAAAAAVLFTGPLAQSASAATLFQTVNSAQTDTQLAISSSSNNAPLVFVPEFEGTFVCSTCGIAGIPDQQVWSLEKLVVESRNKFIVNRQTGKCADVELAAQAPDADPLGARVVISPCDGTASQRWNHLFAAGARQSTFQNRADPHQQRRRRGRAGGFQQQAAVPRTRPAHPDLRPDQRRRRLIPPPALPGPGVRLTPPGPGSFTCVGTRVKSVLDA
jgi:hypothetical protein